jgi:serine/threonine-protein kinase
MSMMVELRRRKVFRVGAAYLVAAWLAIQAVSIGFPAFDVPASALRLFILFALLGFPVVLVAAWMLVLTPQGVKWDPATRGTKRLVGTAAVFAVLALGWYFRGLPAFRAAEVASTASGMAQLAVDDPSIAVLPFVNMSSDREQDYFSDGLSEELLNMLAQVPQLRVIARTSSFSFKGKDADVATIAHALNVAHVLEGSVRKSGETLRITVQLIRASDSSHLWSQTYDREVADVFKVQDDIARAVVAALRVRLLPDQRVRNTHRSVNAEAYLQYLLGNKYNSQGNSDDYKRAVQAYRRAIALDPEYAPAYAALGYAEVFTADDMANIHDAEAADARGLAAAEKAIALAPQLADGYAARGFMRSNFIWDWEGAQADLEQALALDASDATIQRRYGQLLGSLGRVPEAIAAMRKAIEIDPLSAPAWSNLGYYLMGDGRLPEAQQALQRTLDLNPDSVFAQANLAQTYLMQGHAKEALAGFQRVDKVHGLYGVAIAQHELGNAKESDRALEEIKAGLNFTQAAEVYAWRGEKDEAFAWLERGFVHHDPGLADLKFDPLLANVRDDPRFAALVRKMGLPE